ncbi:hypothetical protein KGO95_02380 [Patescibacteria group bacterium]|nr:hypothetical protein [Patescibacteria group bacterium]
MNFFSYLRDRKGQMMVEATIAITIAIIGLLGIFSLTSSSLGETQIVTSQYVGSNLASEGIEIVKNMIDKNVLQNQPWNIGITAGDYEGDYSATALSPFTGSPLLFDPVTGFYQYTTGNTTSYIRKITIDTISADEIKVTSYVSWTTRGGGAFNVDAEDYFYNWR